MLRLMSVRRCGVLLLFALAACDAGEPAAPPNPPSRTANQPAVPDPTLPVVSGNTATAADVAAVAALNARFDPSRDPAKDLEMAVVEAQRGGKRILLEVGGDWCARCPVLDTLVEGDAELRSLRDANFVWVKVHYSPEQPNQPFLSRYPPIENYPHLFVLDGSPALLHSQSAVGLEKGEGYDRARLLALLKQWSPARP